MGTLLVAGALTVPLGLQAQDRDDHHDRDDHDKNHRVYDRDHKDYHQWNCAYRQWYEQRFYGKEYRDFERLKREDQVYYWKWRQLHGDNDDHH